MQPENFRRSGHAAVDWIAEYQEHIRDYPVLPAMQPGELIDALPTSAPDAGESMDVILADFQRLILPAVTHWNHPGFLAYFANSSTEPGIVAELLAAALNVNGMIWRSSPAVTELEAVTMGWLRQWLGLPPEFFGIIYDTASISSFHAIVAAREAAAPEARRTGDYSRLTMYCSELAHSSIEKSAVAAGIGQDNIRKIGVDGQFRMKVDELAAAVQRDRANGMRPFCVIATAGTTTMASVDPVGEISRVAAAEGLWLHVDGAYGGATMMLPSMRALFEGVEKADSFVVNPHKWMMTPVDLSAFYTRRPDALRRAFSLTPEYLRGSDESREVNLMDYSVALGRRFRALKLWFVMRHHGREGMAAMLERHMRDAAQFAEWVRQDERFELCAPVLFSLVCFRLKGPDAASERLLQEINRSGKAFLSHGVIDGRMVIRMAIGNYRTTLEDVRAVWKLTREIVDRTAESAD